MKVFACLLAAYCCLELVSAGRKSCEFDNAYIAGHNYHELKDVSFETCKRVCITDPTRKCQSADYNKKERRCALSALSYDGAKQGDFLRKSAEYDLMSVCPKVTKQDLYMYDGLYVGVNNYKDVRDVDAKTCRKMCLADSRCRHAEYVKDIRRCKFSDKTCDYFHEHDLVRTSTNHVLIAACHFRSTCHYDNTYIHHKAYETIRSMSEEQCRFRCMTDPSKKCLAANYNKKISRCFLLDMTYLQADEKNLVRENQPDFALVSTCPTAENSALLAYEGVYIAENNYKNIPHMLKEQCLTACVLDSQCRTAEYRAKDKRCFLSKMTCGEAKKQDLIRRSSDYVLFATCPLVKNCEKPNHYISEEGIEEMRGLTSEGCKNMCLSDPREECKHSQYDKKIKRCFLSKMSYRAAQGRDLIRASSNFNLYYAC